MRIQKKFLKKLKSKYDYKEFIGLSKTVPDQTSGFVYTFYDKNNFTVDGKPVYYCNTRDNRNIFKDSSNLKICSGEILGIKLKHKNTSKNIIVINVHLEHNDKKVDIIKRKKNFIIMLNDICNKLKYSNDDTILLMGDFNEFYKNNKNNNNGNLNLILNSNNVILKPHHNGPTSGPTGDKMIRDLIYSNKGIKNVKLGKKSVSDHIPVIGELKIDTKSQQPPTTSPPQQAQAGGSTKLRKYDDKKASRNWSKMAKNYRLFKRNRN